MKQWIEDLLLLQENDMRVRQLKTKLELIPKERTRLTGELATEKEALKAVKEKIQKAEMDVKKTEGLIAQENQKIQALQQQSIQVKKNNEYQALMSEIENHKKKIGDFETEEIALLDVVESAKADHKEHDHQFAAKEKSLQAELKEFDQLTVELNAEIERLKAERPKLQIVVDKNALTVYSRLLGSSGTPMVTVQNGGMCGHCHLKLTPQTLNLARKGALAFCDNCSHLVYTTEE
ncbi:MAG: hypothetical protein A2X49_08135 [Lentisphaerae bacterium GWF2_52_8]|nr:MAG: hypothetical protein A2X49_08135 [Lentisphaerae bacterium GWF2_52_8]